MRAVVEDENEVNQRVSLLKDVDLKLQDVKQVSEGSVRPLAAVDCTPARQPTAVQ